MVATFRGEDAREMAAAPEFGGPMVMKFGGSSVADAACLRRVVEIVAAAGAAEGGLIVVVSAMAGITDQLAACAAAARRGQTAPALATLSSVRARHEAAAAALLPEAARQEYGGRAAALVAQTEGICRAVAERCRRQRGTEAAARALITGLGERLMAPLLAAAVAAAGQPSEAIAATELILLTPAGEPEIEPTAARCQARLRPLLLRGWVPVVTGFICAGHDGAPATLGRGGSDYSATLVAAAMEARASIIWTDVDGVYDADPRRAPNARLLSELSYDAAARLACGGAKVLHPKCLEPARRAGIPVWVRNTFRPERAGTRVGAHGGAPPAAPVAAAGRGDAAAGSRLGARWREV